MPVSANGLDNFVERPVPLLQEVIQTLDAASRAAVALVFMRGGWLARPITLQAEEESAIELLGANAASVRAALQPLDGSLLMLVQQKGQFGWRAKHPTVLDAFANLVAEDRELMDIYLIGTPVGQLILKVSCGDFRFGGLKVEVPSDRYDVVIGRVRSFYAERRENHGAVYSFLAHRCGKVFLQRFLVQCPDFMDNLYVMSYFDSVPSIDVINKLHSVDLLPEGRRLHYAAAVRELAVETPDAGFLEKNTISFLTAEEIEGIVDEVRVTLLPRIRLEVEIWQENYSGGDDPQEFFEPLKGALSDFALALKHDEEALILIEEGNEAIDEAVAELSAWLPPEPDHEDYFRRGESVAPNTTSRSIFDDVDE